MTKLCGLFALIFPGAVVAAGGQAPDQPRHGDWEFNLKKVWEIDHVADAPLVRPAELRVAPDGTLYFHDFQQHTSHVLAPNGKLIRTFARQGRGPGEVSRYLNCFTTGDQVVIGAPRKLHFFTKEGEFIKSVSNDLFQRFPLVFLSESEFFFASGALADGRGRTAKVVRADLATGQDTVFAKLRVSPQDFIGGGAVVIGLTPQLNMAYDREAGRLYYGNNAEYAIHGADLNGKELLTFGLKRERATITDEDKRKHFEYFGVPKDRIDGLVERMPNELAYYHRIQVNGGLVYVFAVEGIGHRHESQQIDIFDPEGTYLYRARVRFGNGKHIFGNPDTLRIQGRHLYVILEDDTDKITIAKYEITLPARQARNEPEHSDGYVRLLDIPTPKTEHRTDVGGRKLHSFVYGSGNPAVVLVSGFAAPQQYWNSVVPDVAGLTTVVTYDRAGYGESELGDASTDGKRTVQDLRTLLQKLDIPGPYILVGHSYGGKLVRLYAAAYPEDMAGLILEDTGHEDMKDAIQGVLSGPELDRFVEASSGRPDSTGGPGAEAAVLELTHRQLRESKPLPQIPLTVLTAGSRPVQPIFTGETAERVRALWLEFQKKLAGMIPGSRHVTVDGAGHNIHLDRPKVLIEAIEAMVEEVRRRAT